jgi:alpha-L-fucosidase
MSIDKSTVEQQHAMIGVRRQGDLASHTQHPDAQWFGQAGLGLFLQWGISSVCGEGEVSWSMIYPKPGSKREVLARHGAQGPGRIMTPKEYWAQAERFNPVRYDPDRWLSAARCAGFTYAVLTAKHHDGFALWPSALGELSTRTYLKGRDLVGESVAACRQNDMKVGLYFSMPDWFYNRQRMSFRYGKAENFFDKSLPETEPDLGMEHEPVTLPVVSPEKARAWGDQFKAFCRGQIEELLTRYGKVDILWFDGFEKDAITEKRIRKLQPGIVINDRMGFGDFFTPEGVFPKKRPVGWWEECHVWNEGAWAYRTHETYKPTSWVTSELARVRAWGGNFLLNMALNAHGDLPPVAYQRLEELAGWMAHSRESVEGTTPGPWPEQCNVPVTCRPGAWYLHLDWVWDGPVKLRGIKAPRIVTRLRTGEKVAHTFRNSTLRLELAPSQISLLGEVVKVTWQAEKSS